MRLLYVCADPGIALRGTKGASAHVRQVTAALARRGHTVTLACRRVDGDSEPPGGVLVEVMPTSKDEHERWLADLCWREGVEAVVERYSLASGAAHRVAAAQRIRLVLEVNAPLVREAARYRGLLDVERRSAHERELLRAADAVVAVSEAVAAHALGAGVPSERVAVIPNGVEVSRFVGADGTPVRRRHGLSDAVVVGFCGSLKPWHGVDLLIDAVGLLGPEVHLLVVGDGPERARLLECGRRRGLGERMVMTGAVSYDLIPSHLAAMDIGVAPYGAMDDFYFSPLKVVEYLAAGLPVVASALGELRNFGGAVQLVPPGDVTALARALGALVSDPARRGQLGERGPALAARRTWDGVAVRLEGLLRTALVAA